MLIAIVTRNPTGPVKANAGPGTKAGNVNARQAKLPPPQMTKNMKQITNVFKISEAPGIFKALGKGPVIPNIISKSITKLTRDKELGNNFWKSFWSIN